MRKVFLLIFVVLFGIIILGGGNCDVSAPEVDLSPIPTVTPTSTSTPTPVVGKLLSAFYRDANENGKVDEGDEILLSFNEPINEDCLDVLSSRDFEIHAVELTADAHWEGFSEFMGNDMSKVKIELIGNIENIIPGKVIINVKPGALCTEAGSPVCTKAVRLW